MKRGVILLAATLGLAACSHDRPPAAQAPIPVRTAPVVRRAIALPLELTGNVVAARETALAAAVPGRVVALAVRAGSRVRAGDPIAVIDPSTYRAQEQQAQGELLRARGDAASARSAYAAAQARLELARTTERRMANLYAEGAVSHQDYDEAHGAYLAARAGLEQAASAIQAGNGANVAAGGALAAASTALSETTVRAPFDGVIVSKLADPGTVLAPGTPIAELQDDTAFDVDVALPQDQAEALAIGQAVRVRIDGLDALALLGRVRSITPSSDPAARSVLAKIALPAAPGVIAGMYGRVDVEGAARTGIAVPLSALATRAGQTGVFVVSAGVATFVPVRTGGADLSFVHVDGLRPEDREVAVGDTSGLTDGTPVTPLR